MDRVPTAARTLTLGRYQILKHLTEGGMAELLLARTSGIEGFERHVVIKRIRVEQSRDRGFVKMFLDEARLAATLHHQNVIQVHDIGEQDGEYFFAMEYVHGVDLRQLLMAVSQRGEQVPLEIIVGIIAAVAAGLHHAHEQRGTDRMPLGIVHRDVSPANILLGYDGSVKVVDFGIAKAALRPDATRSGVLKGKVAYMSPEHCLGQSVDRRSDVYALGIVLYELATVRRLFKHENEFLMMSSIVQGDIPPPSSNRPDLPPELEKIIMKAMALRPEERYQTADEVHTDLDRFAEVAGLRSSANGLASYIKQVVGARPEPWLVEDDEPEIELGFDFDGSGSGIVPVPTIELGEPADGNPEAPIQRARRAATNLERFDRPDTNRPVTKPPAPPRSRTRIGLAVGGVAFVIVASVVVVILARDRDPEPPPRAVPPTLIVTPIPVEPAATIVTEPAPVVTAPPPPTKVDRPPTTHRRRVTSKPEPKGELHPWDPNSLFPK